MPNQRYESHHKICKLRYGTLVMGGVPDGETMLWIIACVTLEQPYLRQDSSSVVIL